MIQLNCRNCGASLGLDLTKPKITCKYCKAEYLIEQLLTENRIDDLDNYNRLEPVAHNAYELYNYNEALKLYRELLKYGQKQEDIARCNICMLGVEIIKPTEEFFKSIECLKGEEKYNQIRTIKYTAAMAAKNKTYEVINGYSGIDKIKALFNIIKWYKPYKYMMDSVDEMECICGKTLCRGETVCECGMERTNLIVRKRRSRTTFKFTIIISICVLILFGVKYIMYHSI